MDDGSPRQCVVCKDWAEAMHYGVLTCKKCAEFFCRTINMKRIYQCKTGAHMCQISRSLKRMCSECHWKKCLAVGMSREKIGTHLEGAGGCFGNGNLSRLIPNAANPPTVSGRSETQDNRQIQGTRNFLNQMDHFAGLDGLSAMNTGSYQTNRPPNIKTSFEGLFVRQAFNIEENSTQFEERNKTGECLNLIPKLAPIPETNLNAFTFLESLFFFLKSVSTKDPTLKPLLASMKKFKAKRRDEWNSTKLFYETIFMNLRNAYYSINEQKERDNNAGNGQCLCEFLMAYSSYIQRMYPYSPHFTTLVSIIHNEVSNGENQNMVISANGIFNAFSPIFYYFI